MRPSERSGDVACQRVVFLATERQGQGAYHIQSAERAHYVRDHGLDLLFTAHIGQGTVCPAPSSSNFTCCDPQNGFVCRDVVERDIKAVRGETESDRPANALAGAGHESNAFCYCHCLLWRRENWSVCGAKSGAKRNMDGECYPSCQLAEFISLEMVHITSGRQCEP